MKILLVCNQGMSTGMLVESMKKFGNEDDVIEATPVSHVQKMIDKFDVLLVGPQIRYKLDEINAIASQYNKKVEVVDMVAYGTMDGKKVMEQARKLYERG